MANGGLKENLARARELLMGPLSQTTAEALLEENGTENHADADAGAIYICPECGATMIVIDTFMRGHLPRAPPKQACRS